jgi:hypothetical protein
MALPYDRKFTSGRQSEMLFNEEMHKIYESLRHLLDVPEGGKISPDAKLHGSLWLDMLDNELKFYDKDSHEWTNVFANKFKIVDQITQVLPPDRPVLGQLWLNNGLLMYFDGAQWNPIKALVQDGSDINIAAFEDFLILSPFNPKGGMVVNDAYRQAILDGKLDVPNNAQFLETPDFGPSWPYPKIIDNFDVEKIPADVMCQFLVPNIDIGKFFVEGKLEPHYTEVNKVTIEYPKIKLVNGLAARETSYTHVNPCKMTGIKKRFVKVDKLNPSIHISAFNTEFYGFRKGEITGRLMRPSRSQGVSDYTPIDEGIYMSYEASQNYDYVLAVTYEFSWLKSSGRLTKTSSNDKTTSYYLSNYGGPINVFVDGYDLENTHFDYDSMSKVVNLDDETLNNEVSVLRTYRHEYGWIREYTLDGRGIAKAYNKYIKPLVFINGEVIHPNHGDIEFDGSKIYITGARRNMVWSIIELADILKNDDMFYAADKVTNVDALGNNVVLFDTSKIAADEGVVLFIDGMLIKKEDIIRNDATGTLTTSGLYAGQEYVLLKDKYHNLYNETDLCPAMVTGKTDESMVFMNGFLLCNDTSIATVETKELEELFASNGEMKLFIASDLDRTVGEWTIYDSYRKTWNPLSAEDIANMKAICYSYENTLSAIKINIPFVLADEFYVYAYNFANTIDRPLVVRSFIAYDEKDFSIDNTYIPETESLSVYIDGVRQFWVKEHLDGAGFSLPSKVTGKITYVIQNPENGARMSAEREYLTPANILAPNVYRTKIPLFPGRVNVFVSGVRQQKESFTVLDNYTILFKDNNTSLLGTPDNFPNKTILMSNNTTRQVPLTTYDDILVEVKQDFERQEQTILWEELNNWDIDIAKYDLPKEILEANDEIMIFVNGLYTGLRRNLGYRLDRARGCITILSSSVIEGICTDPLYNYLQTHQDKRLAYKTKYGHDYVPKIENKITFEWR